MIHQLILYLPLNKHVNRPLQQKHLHTRTKLHQTVPVAGIIILSSCTNAPNRVVERGLIRSDMATGRKTGAVSISDHQSRSRQLAEDTVITHRLKLKRRPKT